MPNNISINPLSVFFNVSECYESKRVRSLDLPYKKQIDMIMTIYFLYVFCMQVMVFFIAIKDVYDKY